MQLKLGSRFTLPIEAVTTTHGILAIRGAGKSNAGVVIAEEMYDAGAQWVGIDPKGDWWGIRSNQSGKGAGLPIPVFGGLHGDIPLEPGAGKLMAQLVVERRLTCVLDVSEFSKNQLQHFLVEFGEELYRLKARQPSPLHLFLEECDQYIPQRVQRDETRVVNTFSKLVRLGRSRGIGVTLISQRSAKVNKDVLTQLDALIAMRTTGPQDKKAIQAWVEHQSLGRDLVDSLPELDAGEAWFWSPHAYKVMERMRFRMRRTFDSGATPTMQSSNAAPTRLADIDLGEIQQLMAATIEKAQADDPKVLRRRIRDLEQQLADAQQKRPAPERIVETVEVPVFTDDDLNSLTHLLDEVRIPLQEWGEELTAIRATFEHTAAAIKKPAQTVGQPAAAHAKKVDRKPDQPPTAPRPPSATSIDTKLGRAERAILTVLAQHPAGRTKIQVALLSGYSVKSSSLSNALGALRSAGYVTRGGDLIQATRDGVDALGGDYDPLPTGRELIDFWRARLGKAERAVLDALLDAYPAELTKDEVAERSGYSATSSSLSNALGKLRSLELVDGWRASEDLVEGGAR